MPTRREILEAFIPDSPHAAQLGIRVASVRVADPEGAVVAHGIATYRFG